LSPSSDRSRRRIAIVTGGSRGIGRNTVLSLAKNGVDSIFTYLSNRDEAEKAAAEVQALGRTAVVLQLDVTDVASFDAFAEQVREALAGIGFERFDYLINNAGTSLGKSFAETTEADLDALYSAHVKSVFFLTQRLLPLMNDGGRIVNISSGLTRFTSPRRVAYACMKGAVETLTLYLASELGPRGIAVNTVAPGAIATDFSGGVVRDNPEVNRHIAEITALGRAGEPDDVGPMIGSLLSPANRWINAQRIERSALTFR
jgi:NAD(P)-dependent dehydrogenase (short-subunit alcohol dehydrogenase family)